MSRFWKGLYVFLIAAMFVGLFFRAGGDSREKSGANVILFSDFLGYVKAGYVDGVVIRGDMVEGKFKDPYKTEAGEALKKIVIRDEAERKAAAALGDAKRAELLKFETKIIPYPRLFELLEDKGVPTDVRIDSGGGIGLMRMIDVLGTILWIFVLVMIFKSMRGDKFAAGKANVRMLTQNTMKVYFKDVLGIDDAKEEVTEIVDFLQDPGRYSRLGAKIPKGVLLVG
ncbi:MAG: ATP-dependent metallopeptidase FtsH/Yme1/Tma family protein, partial [Rickettsiales bacterium]|nr:ATP-dependent metallopeptidase FtsH/Yme1/Tma family protein [Rickettsiales bacterium]